MGGFPEMFEIVFSKKSYPGLRREFEQMHVDDAQVKCGCRAFPTVGALVVCFLDYFQRRQKRGDTSSFEDVTRQLSQM